MQITMYSIMLPPTNCLSSTGIMNVDGIQVRYKLYPKQVNSSVFHHGPGLDCKDSWNQHRTKSKMLWIVVLWLKDGMQRAGSIASVGQTIIKKPKSL
jgi:hypothetical protein